MVARLQETFVGDVVSEFEGLDEESRQELIRSTIADLAMLRQVALETQRTAMMAIHDDCGLTWREIGDALGITASHAHTKYHPSGIDRNKSESKRHHAAARQRKQDGRKTAASETEVAPTPPDPGAHTPSDDSPQTSQPDS